MESTTEGNNSAKQTQEENKNIPNESAKDDSQESNATFSSNIQDRVVSPPDLISTGPVESTNAETPTSYTKTDKEHVSESSEQINNTGDDVEKASGDADAATG